jgi:hypothetical protein
MAWRSSREAIEAVHGRKSHHYVEQAGVSFDTSKDPQARERQDERHGSLTLALLHENELLLLLESILLLLQS